MSCPWQGLYKGAESILILHDFEVFLAEKCTFGPFRAPRGAPRPGPRGSPSQWRAGPPKGGPGLSLEGRASD